MARNDKPYQVGLTISHSGKGIPYGGHRDGETNDDGTPKNLGFKNLKGRLHLLDEVPELLDNPALYDLAKAVNQPDGGLISVGCAGWDRSDNRGHRWDGYFEFAINSAEKIADASSYFPMFFHFDRMLHEDGFDQPVTYNWELIGASFWPTKADGFTCAVGIYTPYAPTLHEAKEAWQEAVRPLIPFLGSFPQQQGTPLFTAETDCDLS